MRHRKRGRRLGRSSSHRKAMLRNLASSLFLTEREPDDLDETQPKVRGRVVTTLHKAKEVKPLVEKCITIARRSMTAREAAAEFAAPDKRGSDAWKKWRQSDTWQKWNQAVAPDVAARRRVLRLLGDPQAVSILFEEVAPRFADRPGGYTRVMRLATPRLGDAGERAILEFVGVRDRVVQKSEKPAFSDDEISVGIGASGQSSQGAPSEAAAESKVSGAAEDAAKKDQETD